MTDSEKTKEYSKNYYKLNKAKILENQKIYERNKYSSPEEKEKLRRYNREYYNSIRKNKTLEKPKNLKDKLSQIKSDDSIQYKIIITQGKFFIEF